MRRKSEAKNEPKCLRLANTDATITSSSAYRGEGAETGVQIGRDGVYRYKSLKLTPQLAVMACKEPETGIQTLHSPSYATGNVRLS